MEELLAGLRAVAEITRLRILFALSHGEMNVTELTHVLGQSQPRVSRHLKLMTEAGLIAKHKEGNWVLFRQREEGRGGALARALVDMLPAHDAILAEDLQRLEEIRRQRQALAASYFAANAAEWQKLRSLHVQEDEVEAAILSMLDGAKFSSIVDLGTGTGRMLELLAPRGAQLWGIDQSRDMLAIARANIERAGLKNAQIRQADIYALPMADASADLITIHQVLHFLDDPQRALLEARRILKPGGQILMVDFAPHELEELRTAHAHRRLGISAEQMSGFLARAGLVQREHKVLPPPWLKSGAGLTVSLWLAALPTPQLSTPRLSKAPA
ncbi:MAG: metalloregulator ArsR/SmtB family transcription factor [Alphaproteobacteria bacterium]|nr:metalloregulator ArsR/SmtB family transcription factor [Alphaproteobacteria bacterium]